MRIWAWIVATAGPSGLSACGKTTAEQALYGADAGGATVLLLNNDPSTGAIVGSAGNLFFCQTSPGNCY